MCSRYGVDDATEIREDLFDEVLLDGGEVEGFASGLQGFLLGLQLLELGTEGPGLVRCTRRALGPSLVI